MHLEGILEDEVKQDGAQFLLISDRSFSPEVKVGLSV